MHEIGRIIGRKVFQIGGNVVRISGNKFYDRKNEIQMKIQGMKRSGIGLFVEFQGILTRFLNHIYLRTVVTM
jgi:hypothetical protein